MKQGLPEAAPMANRTLTRVAGVALALAALGLALQPCHARAQDRALVMVADLGGVAPDAARSAFDALIAELRARHPTADLEGETSIGPAATFVACERPRCRASLMLRWHAFAVVMVTLAAIEDEPSRVARVVLRVYDAGGERARTVDVELPGGDPQSDRNALRTALESLSLPRPTMAPLLVTCDIPGARVFLDERPLGVVPLGVLRVVPGRHRLHVSAPGYVPHDQRVDVPAAGARVDLRLRASEAP